MSSHTSFEKQRTEKTAGEDQKQGRSVHLIGEKTSRIAKNPSFNTGGDNNQRDTHHGHHPKSDADWFSAFKPTNSCTEGTANEVAKHRKDDKSGAEEQNRGHPIGLEKA